MTLFNGSGVAIITPFNEDKSINFEAFGNLIEFQIQNKTDAIIVCGTTGETATLSDEERVECVRFAVHAAGKRVPVIAGAGSNCTSHAAELSKQCQTVGADAILSVTPYYNKATQKGLINHFSIIAKAVDIPVILYNVPSRTCTNILPKTVYELSKIENIVALKDACDNIGQTAQTFQAVGNDDFVIYSGNDNQIVPLMSLGGRGVISTCANIIPLETHDIVFEYLNGNLKKATELQLKYLRLIDALFCEVNPIPVKTALNLMGMNGGAFREPMCEMETSNLELLKKEMSDVGLL